MTIIQNLPPQVTSLCRDIKFLGEKLEYTRSLTLGNYLSPGARFMPPLIVWSKYLDLRVRMFEDWMLQERGAVLARKDARRERAWLREAGRRDREGRREAREREREATTSPVEVWINDALALTILHPSVVCSYGHDAVQLKQRFRGLTA